MGRGAGRLQSARRGVFEGHTPAGRSHRQVAELHAQTAQIAPGTRSLMTLSSAGVPDASLHIDEGGSEFSLAKRQFEYAEMTLDARQAVRGRGTLKTSQFAAAGANDVRRYPFQ